MRKKNTLTFLLTVTTLFFSNCRKDFSEQRSQTGANTISARVNGQVWKKKGCFSCISGGSSLIVDYSNGNLYIMGQQGDENMRSTLEIVLNHATKLGNYSLAQEINDNNYAEYVDYTLRDAKYFITSTINNGSVTITKLDRENKIISGTFSIAVENRDNAAEIIKITEGAFDVKIP
jgi:hypothetical protein